MNYKISIVIPIYNAEKYLEKCVNSLRKQTLTDIQIILVDDGSKDTSAALCDNLSKQDSRIFVIHKKNGGVSSARIWVFRVLKVNIWDLLMRTTRWILICLKHFILWQNRMKLML